MHHQIRVTDEEHGRRAHNGTYIVPEFEIVVSVDWTGVDAAQVAAALEAATNTALRQINATSKDTP